MDTFYSEDVSTYHDEFNTLPYEYYDSGCRDWREEFYHVPTQKPIKRKPYTEPKVYPQRTRDFLIMCSDIASYRDDPETIRDKHYYAYKYMRIFENASRYGERVKDAMSAKELDKLVDHQYRYEAVLKKIERSGQVV